VFDSALFLEERGEKAQARELYAQALSLDPDHVPSLLNLAHLLDATGDREEATRLLARALPMLKERREKRAVEEWMRTVSGQEPSDSRGANPGTVSGPNPHDSPGTRPAR
jgi:Flp pilus assembly protein TadD